MLPTGAVSAWPQERHEALYAQLPDNRVKGVQNSPRKKIKASGLEMARGMAKVAMQGLKNGKVSKEVREERYDTCKACPLFDSESKRCTDCGCFMEAKTWIGGDPDMLCPQKKWSR